MLMNSSGNYTKGNERGNYVKGHERGKSVGYNMFSLIGVRSFEPKFMDSLNKPFIQEPVLIKKPSELKY